ncbi:HHR060Cp [Eremothecium sinecaudum]|uniref:protein-tyrosine-phosphatase n=1 Tax=Eremothecium sinecaudum TaxID=45286 RepID=A0A0X8HWJ1_9SACH|nr:HHR060Cp [Eremothecium sinecaudum]AMD22829.1 HHR060Cp [Eremothecium sinecaudum]
MRPWYLIQGNNRVTETFRDIQREEDERIRDATIHPETSKWKLGVSVDALNDRRNRYVNIMPYERNRVKLGLVSGNDYINASYITINVPGQSAVKGNYIATQGPTRNTWPQFWQMCFHECPEEHIVIISVTPLVENGREKCFLYWPTKDAGMSTIHVPKRQAASNLPKDVSVFETDLDVEYISESIGNGYVKTNLAIIPSDGTFPMKIVHHFYFDKWKDMSKPDEIEPILELSRHSHRVSSPGNPIIVHCSAGVGRSGTFITLDHLIHDTLDFTRDEPVQGYPNDLIEEIVRQLRRQRQKMVQLVDQFTFIYQFANAVYDQKQRAIRDRY